MALYRTTQFNCDFT